MRPSQVQNALMVVTLLVLAAVWASSGKSDIPTTSYRHAMQYLLPAAIPNHHQQVSIGPSDQAIEISPQGPDTIQGDDDMTPYELSPHESITLAPAPQPTPPPMAQIERIYPPDLKYQRWAQPPNWIVVHKRQELGETRMFMEIGQ